MSHELRDLLIRIDERTTRTDVAVRPADYGQPGYTGPVIEPVWQEVDSPDTAARFGYTPEEVRALVLGGA